MKLGTAQKTITPSLERTVYLAGFGQNRTAETIHDDLYVRVLSLQEGPTTLVLCAVDLIGLFRPDVLDISHRVRKKHPEAHILIASTHTHHGPDTQGMWGPDSSTPGVDKAYMEWLKDTIAETILQALALPHEAVSLKTCMVTVTGVAKNARDPDVLDQELTCVQFLDTDRVPLATLMNFPCHPETLWETNPHITSDYPGFLRREVEQQTDAPCIFFSGALGGMMTPDVSEHSFKEAETIGHRLAGEGLAALAATNYLPASGLSISKRILRLRLTNILFKLAIHRKLFPDVRDRSGRVETEVNLLKIGPCWFAAVPGELLPKLGLELKAALKAAGAVSAGVISLANDELGYILPEKEFRYPLNPFKPGSHYEETMSLNKTIGTDITAAVSALLEEE